MLMFQDPRISCPNSSEWLQGPCRQAGMSSRPAPCGADGRTGFAHTSWPVPCVLQLRDTSPSRVSEAENMPSCSNPSSHPKQILLDQSPNSLHATAQWLLYDPLLSTQTVPVSLLLSWVKLQPPCWAPCLLLSSSLLPCGQKRSLIC